MRALVYTAPRQLRLEDWPRPTPANGEVEIAVSAAGICGSDISGFLGHSRRRIPPMVMGHELVGRMGNGQRVVANPRKLRSLHRLPGWISKSMLVLAAAGYGSHPRLLCRLCINSRDSALRNTR